jgi:hypothetical protein
MRLKHITIYLNKNKHPKNYPEDIPIKVFNSFIRNDQSSKQQTLKKVIYSKHAK